MQTVEIVDVESRHFLCGIATRVRVGSRDEEHGWREWSEDVPHPPDVCAVGLRLRAEEMARLHGRSLPF